MPQRSYEIHVRGDIDERVLEELPEVTARPPARILYAADLDQATLHGILDRLAFLGLELVEVRQVAARTPDLPTSSQGE